MVKNKVFFCLKSSLTCPSQIFLQGLINLNRAVHEDIVAVEILPKKQWTCPSSVVTTTLLTGSDDDEDSDDDSDLMVYMYMLYFYIMY